MPYNSGMAHVDTRSAGTAGGGSVVRVAVLVPCHDRKETTLACLAALAGQRLPPGVALEVLLVDDGSRDGTGEAVRESFPAVRVLEGDGTLYWAGALRLAFTTAIDEGFDHCLWLNDDTALSPDAVARLLETLAALERAGNGDVIVCGATRDPDTGRLTYGGVRRRSRLRPLVFRLVPEADAPVPCDTTNGNCVLVPNRVAARLGGLSAEFTHTMADYDFGLRALGHGVRCWVAPGTVGTCRRRTIAGTWMDPAVPLRRRLGMYLSPKGLPPAEWWVFARRHAGVLWPIAIAKWSLMPFFPSLLRRIRGTDET